MIRRLMLVLLIVLVGATQAGSAGPLRAQDDALALIRAAYDDFATWQTYRVTAEDFARYALVVDGARASLWQTREYSLAAQGWFNLAEADRPLALLRVDGESVVLNQSGGDPQTTTLEVDLARIGDRTFWRGTVSGPAAAEAALPDEWAVFGAADAAEIELLAALTLRTTLLDGGAGVLRGGYAAWLDAVTEVSGPRSIDLEKGTPVDLYTLEVDLAALPAMLENRFEALTEGGEAVINRDALRERLLAASSLSWEVALDPASGQLVAQAVRLDLSAKADSSALQRQYTGLSLLYSERRAIIFRAVNEPVDAADLPE